MGVSNHPGDEHLGPSHCQTLQGSHGRQCTEARSSSNREYRVRVEDSRESPRLTFYLPSLSSCLGVSDSLSNQIPPGNSQQVDGVHGWATYFGYKILDRILNMPCIFLSASGDLIRYFPQVKKLENPHPRTTSYLLLTYQKPNKTEKGKK